MPTLDVWWSWALAGLGVAVGLGVWAHYFWRVSQERVPVRPVGHAAAMVFAGLAGLTAVLVGLSAPNLAWGLPWLALVLAPVSVGNTAFFLWLLTQAPTPDTQPAVAVGDPLPAFAAITHDGRAFSSAELEGDRVLIKFFRGHW